MIDHSPRGSGFCARTKKCPNLNCDRCFGCGFRPSRSSESSCVDRAPSRCSARLGLAGSSASASTGTCGELEPGSAGPPGARRGSDSEESEPRPPHPQPQGARREWRRRRPPPSPSREWGRRAPGPTKDGRDSEPRPPHPRSPEARPLESPPEARQSPRPEPKSSRIDWGPY